VALIGHLQVANECRAASATLTAASSGPIPKAPGSAGGYLPGRFHLIADHRRETVSFDLRPLIQIKPIVPSPDQHLAAQVLMRS
jgi:hypothetical protein